MMPFFNEDNFPICQRLSQSGVVLLLPANSELNTGKLWVEECCTYRNGTNLTKAEVYQLADELKQIGDLL